MTGVGVALWCLDPVAPPPLRQLAALGLGALHVDFGVPGEESCFDRPDTCHRHFTQTRDTGLRISAFALNALETLGIAETGAETPSAAALDMVARAVATAARWSVPLVYVPHFGRARIDGEPAFRAATALLRAACERAAGSDVLIATENVLAPRAARRLLEAVGMPNIRALADLYNPVRYGHATVDVLRATLPFLVHQIHVKDGRGGALGNAALGEGDARFDDSADFLVAHNVRCTAILENDYTVDALARLGRDIATARARLGDILLDGSPRAAAVAV